MGSGFGPGIFAESCSMCLVLTHKMSSIVNDASVTTLRKATRTSISVQVSANKYARYLIKRLVAYSWKAIAVLMRAVAISYCPDRRRGDKCTRALATSVTQILHMGFNQPDRVEASDAKNSMYNKNSCADIFILLFMDVGNDTLEE